MPELLSSLDDLINNLESAVENVEESGFALSPGEPPKRATFRIVAGAYTSRMDRQPRAAEAHQLDRGLLTLRSRGDVARGMQVEVNLLLSKDGQGETILQMTGQVQRTQRVSGAYEILIKVVELRKTVVPTHRRFLECVTAGDAAGWNRWCADLHDGPVLQNLDLSRTVLADFDLCCADLSGSNLSDADLTGADLTGADLTGCTLEGVRIAGADLFRATLPRRYGGLIVASGTIEAESVILVD